jgi:hypothetical protein
MQRAKTRLVNDWLRLRAAAADFAGQQLPPGTLQRRTIRTIQSLVH